MFLKIILALVFVWAYFPLVAKAEQDKYSVCKMLPDVPSSQGVAYQPGVDAYGNAVVPADINGASQEQIAKTLKVVRVPLTVDFAQNIVALNNTGVQLEAPLGMLDVYEDGRVLYNGQDWTSSAHTLCGKSQRIVTEVVEVNVPTQEAPQEIVEEAVVVVEEEVEVPVAPQAPVMNDNIGETLPNKLAVDENEATQLPVISEPTVEMVDEVTPIKERLKQMARPKLSEPAEPILPLIGIPKGGNDTGTDKMISGEEHSDYNE